MSADKKNEKKDRQPAKSQGRKARPRADAAAGKGLKIPLWAKLSAIVFALIALVMTSVAVTLYYEQNRTLSKQVIERGRTVAENMAANSKDLLTASDDLQLTFMVTQAVEKTGAQENRPGYGLKPADLLAGLKKALIGLALDLGDFVDTRTGWKPPFVAGLEQMQAVQRKGRENEGIAEAFIVDKRTASQDKGNIIVHNDFARRGEKFQTPAYLRTGDGISTFPIYEAMYQGKKAELFHIERDIVVEGSTLGTVHLGMAKELIDRTVFEATMKVIAISLFAIVLGTFFTLILVRQLVSPVRKLVEGVLAIAGGNFDTQIKVKARDELGELTSSFNQMAKSLSENETLKGAFSRYVSDAALKQILADPSKSGLHSRRVTATVYSSDVRGFTAMSETLQPEQVVSVINTYLSLQTEVILEHGGVVDKFIGDATIGVWGKEEPGPDDALNCVKAALAIQDRIARLNVEREKNGEVAKLIGIGINTGDMISGNMGSSKKMEYTIAGDSAQLADRLCDECKGGKVWISEATLDVVKGKIEYKALEPIQLKGKMQPTPVFEVLGLKKA